MNQQAAQPRILSPTAMLQYGRRFTEAAEGLLGPSPGPVVPHAPVPHYLLAHAIELSFKAYLCACGYSEERLKRLGHDLEAIVAQALGEDLSAHVELEAEELAAIQVVNDLYAQKQLEYASVSPGEARGLRMPEPRHLMAAAKRLQEGLRQFCLEKTRDLHKG